MQLLSIKRFFHDVPWLTTLFGLFVVSQFVVSVQPILVGRFIDALGGVRTIDVRFAFVLLVACMVAAQIVRFVFQLGIDRSARLLQQTLQNKLLDKVNALSPEAMDHYRQGEMGAKFFRDCAIVASSINTALPLLASGAISAAAALTIVFLKDWRIGCFMLLFILIGLAALRNFCPKIKECNRRLREADDSLGNHLFLFFGAFADLKTMGANRNFDAETRTTFDEYRRCGSKLDRTNNLFEITIVSSLLLGECLILGIAGYMVYRGTATVGDVVVYQMLFLQTLGAFSSLFRVLPHAEMINEAVKSVDELLKHDGLENDDDKPLVNDCAGRIELRDVSFRYHDDSPWIFERFHGEIPPGRCVAVTGENGSGKSTLIKLLTSQLAAKEGTVRIDGRNLTDVNRDSLRRFISVVSQDPILLSGSLRDNITLRDPRIGENEIQEVIQLAGLEKIVQKLSNGLDTPIGLDGVLFSGGERQRIAIARALIRKPRIAVFDEISNHLDAVSHVRIREIIQRLKGQCTMILISHDPDIINLAEQTIHLSGAGNH